jgi:hypothetical protein
VGGANHGFSIHEARANFKSHWKIYPRGHMFLMNSPAGIAANQAIVTALEAMRSGQNQNARRSGPRSSVRRMFWTLSGARKPSGRE